MKPAHSRKPVWPRPPFWISVALLSGAAVTTVVLILVSADRDLTGLEQTLFQLMILAASLAGSYMLGEHAARDSAQELMKPAARSAFRRVLGLYASIERLSQRIQELKSSGTDSDHDLEVLQAVVQEQRASANDAMEDWRDLVPEEVEEVEARLKTAKESQEVQELEFGN